MSTDNTQPDDPRDAHLLAALRHAPDRDLVPPAELSATILSAAHAAVRAAARTPPPRPSAWRRWAAWIAQPQASAAFGTLAVAVLVGLLWSTREPPVGEPQAPAVPPAASGTTVADAAPTPAREAGPSPSEGGSPAERRREAAPAAAPTRAAEPVSPAPQTVAKVAGMTSADAAAPAAEAAPLPAGTAAAAPPAPEPTLSVAQESVARQDTGAARAAAAPQAGLVRREVRNMASAPSLSMPSTLSAKAVAPADPLAGVDALLADAGAAPTVRWELPAVPTFSTPHGDAQRAWWARLRAATQGRWAPLQSAPRASPWVVVKVDGRDHARLWFDDAALVWTDAGSGRAWRAPLDDAERNALRSAVARW